MEEILMATADLLAAWREAARAAELAAGLAANAAAAAAEAEADASASEHVVALATAAAEAAEQAAAAARDGARLARSRADAHRSSQPLVEQQAKDAVLRESDARERYQRSTQRANGDVPGER
jgi:hypothetical protein